MSAFDEIVAEIQRATGVPQARAIEIAKRNGYTQPPIVVDPRALEKQHEAAGDRLLQRLGFSVIRFSHPGKTQQTEGISDRKYYRPPRVIEERGAEILRPAFTFWWEAKSSTGRQRPGQKLFQELVTSCGELYALGTYAELEAWLQAHGIDTEEPS